MASLIHKESGRKICSKEHCWQPKNRRERWMHPRAEFLYSEEDVDGGDLDVYRCPVCGLKFKITIPR